MKKQNVYATEDINISQVANEIVKVPIERFLHENYLPYSYYVIRNRALVGVDGLKPVNRRILYSMYKAKLTPNSPFQKAGTVAANTMGHYHPHDNASIEDALARMAQSFSLRVPLIDHSGAVGYNTGDKAAAARYWEARLTKPAMELLTELDDNAIEMGTNFDGTLPEPATLPVKWPVTIINGTQGIAVGYASTVFPHNPTEIMNAAIELINHPDMTVDDLLKIVPGPDFPTGGELVDVEGVKEYYTTGKGTFTIRGRYFTRQLSRGRTQVNFYELPYQVSPEMVIVQIHKLKKDGKFPEISTVKDLSDMKKGLHVEIVLKSGTNTLLTLKNLFQKTPLAKKFSSNEVVLDHGAPSLKGMIGMLEQFLEVRKICTHNKDVNRLNKDKALAHRNKGLITVLLDIDKAIAIIRKSETPDEAQKNLMEVFKIDEDQADYILSMQLRKLTHSDREALINRNNELLEEVKKLEHILNDDLAFKEQIINELKATQEIIKDERRTVINNKSVEDIKAEEKAAKEQATSISKNSSIYISVFADGSLYKGLNPLTVKKNENTVPLLYGFKANAKDDLIAVLKDGTGVKVPSSYLPLNKITDKTILGLDNPDLFLGLSKMKLDRGDKGLLIVTSKGKILTVNDKFPSTMETFPVITLDDNEVINSIFWVNASNSSDNIMLGASNGLTTKFPIDSIRVSSPGSKGIKGMNLDDDSIIVGASICKNKGIVVTLTQNTMKVTNMSELPTRNRGAKGIITHRLTKSSGPVIKLFAGELDKIRLSDIRGFSLPLPPITNRATSGVKMGTRGMLLGLQPEIKENDKD